MALTVTDKPLSGKRALFVAEYLKDRNATQAAIRAGYSEATAKQQGSRLLTRVDIRAAVVVSDTRVVAKVEKSAADISRVAWSIAEDPEAPPSARIQALNLEARRFREYADKHEIDARVAVLSLPVGTTLDDLKALRDGLNAGDS